MRIDSAECVGLIIDIQERLFHYIYDHHLLEINTIRLIQGLQLLKIPLIKTQQYTKGLGPTIQSIDEILLNELFYEKMCFSCADDDIFMEGLQSLGKKVVIIAGMEAHVCVLQTVIDLQENNFMPVVVEDCISSRNPNDKKVAEDRIRREGAIVTTYESILLELTRYSDIPVFKEISKIIK